MIYIENALFIFQAAETKFEQKPVETASKPKAPVSKLLDIFDIKDTIASKIIQSEQVTKHIYSHSV